MGQGGGSKLNNDFICINCGKCCGPVPISNTDWDKIILTVGEMSKREIDRLISQPSCAIHAHKPLICRLQGTHKGLHCPNMPGGDTGGDTEFFKEFGEHGENFKGLLTEVISWNDILP